MFVMFTLSLKAREVMEIYQRTRDIEELEKAKNRLNPEISFPPINTVFDEEELTTKHYSFPNSKLTITANIYYTDESAMGTTIQAGVAVSEKPQENVLFGGSTINAAVAEVALSDFTDRFSAQQYVKVNGRLYRLGLECDCFGRKRILELRNRKN
jgi:hypothetical protein